MLRRITASSTLLILLAATAMADGPADNVPSSVRRIPKLAITLAPAVRKERAGGQGLCLEDRRLGPALRRGRSRELYTEEAAQVPTRRLVPRPWRDAQRGQLPR